MQEQITDLDEARFLGELLDRIAAVDQHTLLAVDERDLALAAARGSEARIVGKYAELAVQRRDVQNAGSEGRIVPLELELRPGLRVDQGVMLVRHASHLR